MKKYLKESVLLILIGVPYIYLSIIWNELPNQVTTHFNISGAADDWSGKIMLPFLPCGLGIFIYLLMLIIPVFDPKKKIQQMGDKYYTFRLMLTFFFSALAAYLLFATKEGALKNPNILLALIGGLFAMLGNYFQAVRPNYFIGIRTPWTIENEQVWKKTHHLAGRLWMIGGISIIILSFIIKSNVAFAVIFGTITLVMILVPIVFSYIEFRKEKKLTINN